MRTAFVAATVCLVVSGLGCLENRGLSTDESPLSGKGPQSAPGAASRGAPLEASIVLRQRAERLWAARTREDWADVFQYQTPAVRASTQEEDFVAWSKDNALFRVLSYELGRVQTEGHMGWVEVEHTSRLPRYPKTPPRKAGTWERWKKIEGQWYLATKKEGETFPNPPWLRSREEEETLRARFEEQWSARHRQDWHAAYLLTDPEDRVTVLEEDFSEGASLIQYLGCDVRWVEAVGDRGRVRAQYHHKLNDPSLTKLADTTTEVTERWVKRDGVWYHDLKLEEQPQ